VKRVRGEVMLSLHGRAMRTTMVAALAAVVFSGCMTGPRWLRYRKVDPNSSCYPGSDEWWAEKAQLPVGTRQRVHHGKVYPPFPRPTGEKQQWSHKFHAAHYWPLPYVCADRDLVSNIWNEQIANGWTEATTLFDYHFETETQELTHPGLMQLQWIMAHAPETRRMVFVQSTHDAVPDEIRLSVVRNAVQQCTGIGIPPTVLIRYTSAVGRPAIELQMIRENEIATTPVPRISPAISVGGIDE
jgi:hypothetical protein